jgi:hypothetical protein
VTQLRLKGGALGACTRSPIRGRAAAGRPVRQLYTRIEKRERRSTRSSHADKDRKRSELDLQVPGNYSTGGAEQTSWLTRDGCDGTLTRVDTGTVRVRDRVRHRTVLVHAGHRYLARAP